MIQRAVVSRVVGSTVFVVSPTSSGKSFERGPLKVYLAAVPSVGTKVLVASIGDNVDDIVVIAKM